MKWLWSLIAIGLLASTSWAQEGQRAVLSPVIPIAPSAPAPEAPAPSIPTTPIGTAILDAPAVDLSCTAPSWSPRSMLSGNHHFDNFIGFMSNPVQSIDPRAVTEFWPVFMSTWVSPYGKLPEGNVQLYGAGLNVALSERLSIGLNQGGYAQANFDHYRQGWLNLGGFAQYTLIEDVPHQFLLTVGLRWEAPSGEAEVFQGHGPPDLAPYLTIGKEFGKFHLLATTGYQFPARAGDRETELFYFNAHLDRQCFGWLYPLVEVNWTTHSTSVDVNRPFLQSFFNSGTFEESGNIATLAAGFNAVLVRNRLELGAVYTTALTTQRIDFNGLLVKMVFRY
jgi:hypothetical protein